MLILPRGDFKIFFTPTPKEEKKVIQEILKTLVEFKEKKIYLWNTGFDVPFLITRAIKNEIYDTLLYDLKFVDLCRFARNNLKLSSNKLDEVSKFLGIKKDLCNTGKNVQDLYLKTLAGDEDSAEKIIEHCKDDVIALREIHQKMKKYVDKWELIRYNKNLW